MGVRDDLREIKSVELREQVLPPTQASRDEVEVLEAKRSGKLAEMRKAEALRGLAEVVKKRNESLRSKGPNFISEEEVTKARAEFAVAEAEVADKKAGLDVADAYLNQAKRRLGIETPEKTADPAATTQPKRPPETRPNADLGEPVEGRRAPSQDELRDAVEVLEAQLKGKRAQLRAAESVANMARRELENTKRLVDKQGMSSERAWIV